MSTEKLELAAFKDAAGLLLLDDFAEIGMGAMLDGCDSPALRILAGLRPEEAHEARALFEQTLAELNIPKPSERDAVMHLAREVAKRILSGATTPYEGATEIWDLTHCLEDPRTSELDGFVYAWSEWEDRPEDHRIIESWIMTEARELMSGRRD